MLKPVKVTIFQSNLCKNGVPMSHAWNNFFFFAETTKPDHKLSKTFYFDKISKFFDCELWMLFYFVWCFFVKNVISSHVMIPNSCGCAQSSLLDRWTRYTATDGRKISHKITWTGNLTCMSKLFIISKVLDIWAADHFGSVSRVWGFEGYLDWF